MSYLHGCTHVQIKQVGTSFQLDTCKCMPQLSVLPWQYVLIVQTHCLVQGQAGPRMHDLSPEPVAHLSQHKLLPLLLHRAHRASGLDSIRFGHSLRQFQQHPDGVSCIVQPLQVS